MLHFGALLFLLFINEVKAITTNTTILFADESKLIGKASSQETVKSDLNSLFQWADLWQMKFNKSECSVLYLGSVTMRSIVHPWK